MAVFTKNLLLKDNQLLIENSIQKSNSILQPVVSSALLLEGGQGDVLLEAGQGSLLLEAL